VPGPTRVFFMARLLQAIDDEAVLTVVVAQHELSVELHRVVVSSDASLHLSPDLFKSMWLPNGRWLEGVEP
jgi:hypothetical protein